nr:aromatic amino acid lyase [Candidatus Contendobacter sp.]
MDITPYLKLMVDKNASDLFFHVGAPVNIKIGGVVRPIGNKVLGPGQVREIAYSVMKDDQVKEFQRFLVYNHAAGIGDPAPIEHVRAALAGRINVVSVTVYETDDSCAE